MHKIARFKRDRIFCVILILWKLLPVATLHCVGKQPSKTYKRNVYYFDRYICKNVATQMQKCGHSRRVTLQYSGLVRQTTL